MVIQDDLRLAGLIDADEYNVLSRVNPNTVARAHAKSLEDLRELIILHATFQTLVFRIPLTSPTRPE